MAGSSASAMPSSPGRRAAYASTSPSSAWLPPCSNDRCRVGGAHADGGGGDDRGSAPRRLPITSVAPEHGAADGGAGSEAAAVDDASDDEPTDRHWVRRSDDAATAG